MKNNWVWWKIITVSLGCRGLGIAVGVLDYYLSDTYGGRGLGLASGAIDGVQGVLSGVAQGVSSIATTAKDGMGKFGRLLTGANMLSVEIPDKYVEVYQDNKEETKEVAEKAAVEYLAGKSVKVEKLPKKSKEWFPEAAKQAKYCMQVESVLVSIIFMTLNFMNMKVILC